MTRDRPRNRPGSGSGGGPDKRGFKPKKGPSAGFRTRAPEHFDPNAPETAGSDKPWEVAKRSAKDARPAESGRDRFERQPKPWGAKGGKPRWNKDRGSAGGDARPDRKPDGRPQTRNENLSTASKDKRSGGEGGRPGRFGGSGLRERHRDRPRGHEQVVPTDDSDEFADFVDFDGDVSDDAPSPDRSPRGRGHRGRPQQGRPRHFERREASFEENGDVWIWGNHAAAAALANPSRRIREAILTRNAAQRLGLDPDAPPAFARILDPKEIDQRMPEGAVHQGAALRCAPLEPLDISDVALQPDKPLVILDQVQDPQNVGAVFRSAAAFGFGGVVMQTRRAPALGGALAKAAAGAIETVPEVRSVNIARAIDALKEAGWRVVGLAGEASELLDQACAGDEPLAIVLGAEGSGLRPAVANACSRLARIPMSPGVESLNVSNAAAVAFYEARRTRS